MRWAPPRHEQERVILSIEASIRLLTFFGIRTPYLAPAEAPEDAPQVNDLPNAHLPPFVNLSHALNLTPIAGQ